MSTFFSVFGGPAALNELWLAAAFFTKDTYSPFCHSLHYFLFYLLTTFLICVPVPSIGFWASSLYILQTFISHCLLDVPWVPQTQYIIIELTSSSSIPKTSPLPYSQAWEKNYNVPSHLRQRPRYLWDSCFYLTLLKIYYHSWWYCKPPIALHPTDPILGQTTLLSDWDHSSLLTGLPASTVASLFCQTLCSQKGL